MQIPLEIYTALIVGDIAAYIGILTRALRYSKEQETDFNVTILNEKMRQSITLKQFVETERDEGTATDVEGLNQRIKPVIEKMWKNTGFCYKADNLLNILHKRESIGSLLCICGMPGAIISGIFYLSFGGPSQNMCLAQMSLVFGLLGLPLIVVAFLVIGNIFICSRLRGFKKEIEELCDFKLVETPRNS